MGRHVEMHLRGVTLGEALTVLADRAHIALAYSEKQVPVQKRVSLEATDISVHDALTVLLAGTGLSFTASHGGKAVVIEPDGLTSTPVTWPRTVQGTATISGYVRDSVTGAAISQVSVHVDATNLTVQSGADGHFTVSGIPAGEYHVTARRVGYLAKVRLITVADGDAKTLDFALNPPATKLDEVVTTALGEQRRYEVGNVISTINVDSIAPTAPVTSVTDLISARAPGVEVLENSGLLGSGETIRIRGVSSMVLQGDPIVIVDGVREDNSPGGRGYGYYFGLNRWYSTPSRLNDINFSDIETIDILKGPAASTEYGTDAASGVIVITTKHGNSGAAVWHADGEQTTTGLATPFSKKYYSWGHLTMGVDYPTDCVLANATAGQCVTDSVTQFNPENYKQTTMFGTGMHQKYDLSVSGGSDAIRYFLEGEMSGDRGVLHMPAIFRQMFASSGTTLPAEAYNSNTEEQRSIRLNTAMKLSPTADLTANVSYLSMNDLTPDVANFFSDETNAPAIDSPDYMYGYGTTEDSPEGLLTSLARDQETRMSGGLTLKWRPMGWLIGSGTVGFDHGVENQTGTSYPNPSYNLGGIVLDNGTNDIYTIDLRLAATAAVTRDVQAVTSFGLQLASSSNEQDGVGVGGLTSSNLTLDGSTGNNIGVNQITDQAATLGGYGEEELSFRQRLFLIGALRLDAASGFGSAYKSAVYPKASVSWLAVTGGRTTVRLRAAWGASGSQPQNGASELLRSATTVYVGGNMVAGDLISWPGNPNLRPERSVEYEGGFDIGGWDNRVSIEFTLYQKVTHDALVDDQLSNDLCCYTYQENLGTVENGGIEGTATFGVIQTRALTWNVTVNASMNHNKLVSLGPNVVAPFNWSDNRNRVGYPLYGFWGDPIFYHDANHDGIIEQNEVSAPDTARYMGPGSPTREASVSTYLGLFHGALTVGGLVDSKGGYRIDNQVTLYLVYGSDPANNIPTTPLWEQARAMMRRGPDNSPTSLYFEDGSFIRWRELSLTYAAPRSLMRHLRFVEMLSLTGAVRNLALWTRYTGYDPESNNDSFNSNDLNGSTPTGNATVNHDLRSDNGSVPLMRDWVIRLNLGLK